MKRKTIKLLIVLSSIALAGIIFSQVYWVNKAVELRKEQFDNSVRIAAKSVVSQFLDKKNDTIFIEHLRLLSCRKMRLEVTDVIQPFVLDSLLQQELKCMNLKTVYYFGIYNNYNNRFVAGKYLLNESKIIKSPYQFSLASIYKSGDYYLGVYFPHKTSIVIRNMWVMLVFSFLFMIVLVTSFVFVIYTILRQKKLSEMKSDFINNLTHEFKTPIATTSLAAEMLMRKDVSKDSAKVIKYGKVILYESNRLQSQVEQILQIASLENGSFEFKYKKVDLHQLLENVVESFELRITKNKILLTSEFNADVFIVSTDIIHITNVFYNLIDNAIKYTPEKPEINIKSWNTKKEIVIRFTDNGIGISREHQKYVFKNLYRVPTGNLHDVRGFGLGLYYSKNVVESLGGHISLSSESGKGSSFDVYLPLNR